eukprot:4099342-Alexandrium_andersonii.AAC.1
MCIRDRLSPFPLALARVHAPLEDGDGGLELLGVGVRLLRLGLQDSDFHADRGVSGSRLGEGP